MVVKVLSRPRFCARLLPPREMLWTAPLMLQELKQQRQASAID
jgi:hypothetical protein